MGENRRRICPVCGSRFVKTETIPPYGTVDEEPGTLYVHEWIADANSHGRVSLAGCSFYRGRHPVRWEGAEIER